MRGDFISIVEAAYAPAATEQEWLQGIADAALSCLDRGLGIAVYTYDGTNPADFRVVQCAFAGLIPVRTDEIVALCQGTGADPELEFDWRRMIQTCYQPGPPESFAQLATRLLPNNSAVPAAFGALSQKGVADVLAVRGGDPNIKGCVLTVPFAQVQRIPPALSSVLAHVGAHMAAGWRLRTALDMEEATDAILDSEGRLLHARTNAIAEQRRLLTRCLHARPQQKLRKEAPDRALALWKALVDGQWTLVDHVDSDGKRFVLAKRNQPEVGDPGALTWREKQVAVYASFGHPLKFIGYQLGLSEPTVSERLKSALRKLGLKSRAELIRLFGRERESKLVGNRSQESGS